MWTPMVPRVSDGTATSASCCGSHSSPSRSAMLTTLSVPMSCCALATGMLSEYFSASRTRTGPARGCPRSDPVAVHDLALTSMNIVAGVMTPDSKPAAYVIGLKADPDWR